MYRIRLSLLFFLSIYSLMFAQKLPVEQFKSMKARCIGPAGMSGRVTAIDAISSQPDHIFIGTASGGVWESKSGGVNWIPIFDNQPTLAIGALTINQNNPAEIWVGTGEGNPRNSQNSGEGIFKSIDGGKTWKCMGLQGTKTIHRIIINKDNPDIVTVAALGSAWGANEDRGVFKTTDGGKTWRKVLYVNDLTGCADLVVDPSNPNKLVAAMWEYNRKPWIFNSGGKSSGMYVSFDGGENWTKRTDKDGLPKGDLGRIGLAFAKNKPNIVYAIVEAKDNAFYRSTDGGYKWQKVADKGFGDRPFYYSEIYVDPKNENRIYSIFTTISRSEDGGKNWNGFAGWVIHPDHHAFWICPDNPDYMINGNDGGLNITRDGGNTWQFADNIPVGQFYHINVDNDIPFNVYGGLQDNGSWVGPSSVWRYGGIRNQDWKEVYFGDGFDVMPKQGDNRYVYAMSQGGALGLIDSKTGSSQYIKPVTKDKTKLRFNWNSALAQNPQHDCGIYYGSQFVHKSMDCGKSWTIISPDLTTNDTLKQVSYKSGGLTPDVTAAENHCTILCIAPSPMDENVIWVGTDDGNIQLTKDGGKTWSNLISNIKGLPKTAWIPQIEVSKRNAAEAFVVVNNYRQNDWKPYLFYTNDYGKSWKRLADENKLKGHVLSVVQDNEEPNLLFCGTDAGLFVSIDFGENWTKWRSDFPSVNVTDMKIHPRDADLVIGTFGRAIWVLDDIRPLREMARTKGETLNTPFKIFKPADAYLAEYRSYEGARFNANALFVASSKPTHGEIKVWVKELLPKKEKKDDKKDDKKAEPKKDNDKKEDTEKEFEKKMKLFVVDEKGDTIRTLNPPIDTFLTTINWFLDKKGVRFARQGEDKSEESEAGGSSALPGKYKLYAVYGTFKDSTFINVLPDPRMNITLSDMKAKNTILAEMDKQAKRSSSAMAKVNDAEKQIQLGESQLVNAPDSVKKDFGKLTSALKDSISKYQLYVFGAKESKGINRNEETLRSYYYQALEYINSTEGEIGENALLPYKSFIQKMDAFVQRINSFLEKDVAAYQKKVEATKFPIMKKIEKVE